MPVIVALCFATAWLKQVLRGEIDRSSPSREMHHRLRELPVAKVAGHDVRVATTFGARLLGLSHLDRDEAGAGLLIPRCAAVHTFGMRFALDLVFLDEEGRPCSHRHAVAPRRFAWDRSARTVLELPTG